MRACGISTLSTNRKSSAKHPRRARYIVPLRRRPFGRSRSWSRERAARTGHSDATPLIWNDLSTTNSVLSFFIHSFFPIQRAVWVAVEEAVTTIDHSDIRGSEPHNRDPSGAASDYEREFGPKTYRIGASRILLRVSLDRYPRCLLCASQQIHLMPPGAETPSALFLLGSRWPR